MDFGVGRQKTAKFNKKGMKYGKSRILPSPFGDSDTEPFPCRYGAGMQTHVGQHGRANNKN